MNHEKHVTMNAILPHVKINVIMIGLNVKSAVIKNVHVTLNVQMDVHVLVIPIVVNQMSMGGITVQIIISMTTLKTV